MNTSPSPLAAPHKVSPPLSEPKKLSVPLTPANVASTMYRLHQVGAPDMVAASYGSTRAVARSRVPPAPAANFPACAANRGYHAPACFVLSKWSIMNWEVCALTLSAPAAHASRKRRKPTASAGSA